MAEMADFLKEESYGLEEYKEQLVKRFIEKVTVADDQPGIAFQISCPI